MQIIDIERKHLDLVKQILKKTLGKDSDVIVFAFGSRVKGNAKRFSDLDLAIYKEGEKIPQLVGELLYEFEESDLPFKVDVIDLNNISEGFRRTTFRNNFEIINTKDWRISMNKLKLSNNIQKRIRTLLKWLLPVILLIIIVYISSLLSIKRSDALNFTSILAIIFSPMYVLHLQKQDAIRTEKMNILKTLMISRSNLCNKDYVSAINVIDIVFHDNCNVLSEKKKLLQAHKDYQSNGFYIIPRLENLIIAIAKNLNYDLDDKLCSDTYMPSWLYGKLKKDTSAQLQSIFAYDESTDKLATYLRKKEKQDIN